MSRAGSPDTITRRSQPPGTLRARGFTLIELMIVVAILGILAAVAVPIFLNYIRDSKKGEAFTNLRVIGDGALVYYHEESYGSDGMTATARVFPDTGGATECSEGNHPDGLKVAPKSTDWSSEVWRNLKFSISKPHYFQYCYTGASDRLSFSAYADAALGGQGTDTRVCIKGWRQPDTGEAIVSSAPFEIAPDSDCVPSVPTSP